MLVIKHSGSGPREIWITGDAGTLPLLHVLLMIIISHTTEGNPLTDTLAINGHRHDMSLHLPLFCIAMCMLLYNNNGNPPLYPVHLILLQKVMLTLMKLLQLLYIGQAL
jgi:hypothetical protein